MATDQEKSHGRDLTWKLRARQAPEHIRQTWSGTSWIVEVSTTGSRNGKPFQATHHFLFSLRTSRCDTSLRTSRCDTSLGTFRCDTSLRTTPEALLQQVRETRNSSRLLS